MRGLLCKDFHLAMVQKRYFLGVFGVMLFLFVTGQNETFVIGYTTMLSFFFTITTINFDDYNKAGSFLFTLPFERKQYALEKYLFGILFGGMGWGIGVISGLISLKIKGNFSGIAEYFLSSSAIFCVMLCFLALMIPIELKFGAEKGRSILLVIWFALFGGIFWFSQTFPGGLGKFMQILGRLSQTAVIALLIAAFFLCFLISVGISMKIMEKKQF